MANSLVELSVKFITVRLSPVLFMKGCRTSPAQGNESKRRMEAAYLPYINRNYNMCITSLSLGIRVMRYFDIRIANLYADDFYELRTLTLLLELGIQRVSCW